MAYLENGVLRAKPRRFFSQRIHRLSLLIQHPSLTTWREFWSILLTMYCLYEAYFTLANLRFLLFKQDVSKVCSRFTTGVDCLELYVLAVIWEILQWVGKGLIWLPLVLVIIFIGEEFLNRRR